MQFSVLLLAAAAAVVHAATDASGLIPLEPPRTFNCNAGTGGNGACESVQLHTYCCSIRSHGDKVTPRLVHYFSQNDQGDGFCENADGFIACA
ncbi:hypothetical protein E4U41_000386 [Claviceps citrina]|nr:hypothetical protein E4U41_000386 [Claviceps citrina]